MPFKVAMLAGAVAMATLAVAGCHGAKGAGGSGAGGDAARDGGSPGVAGGGGTSGGGAGVTGAAGLSAAGTSGGGAGMTGGAGAGGGSTIAGTVINQRSHFPLVGFAVWLGAQKRPSDSAGKFTFDGAPARYDLMIVDPDGAAISIYRGLTRRDPLLAHEPSPSFSDPLPGAAGVSSAGISGTLSGPGTFPLGPKDFVSVQFFSALASAKYSLGGQGLLRGPDYSLSTVWNGTGPLAGQLVALGYFLRDADGGAPDAGVPPQQAAFVSQPLTLSNGGQPKVDLAMVPVAYGHVTGTADCPPSAMITQQEAYYAFTTGLMLAGGTSESGKTGPFDDVVPDLSGKGPRLCVRAVGWWTRSYEGLLETWKCGLAVGAAGVALTLQAPPMLTAPAPGYFSATTTFSWSAFDGGVYHLALIANPPQNIRPSVHVFTADMSATWPDLSALDVAFPTLSGYTATIEGVGPYATMDDAVGPDGIGVISPTELRQSSAPAQSFATR
jgi:hypothetical protein